jgi:hypothetical protein
LRRLKADWDGHCFLWVTRLNRFWVALTNFPAIHTPTNCDFYGRVIIPWAVRRVGVFAYNAVELLSDVPDPLLNFSYV